MLILYISIEGFYSEKLKIIYFFGIKLYQKEIDFVAVKQSEKLYIHLSDDISNKKTFEREVSSLLEIRDNYPKILLANTHHDEYQYEGIKIIDIENWLSK